jgi:hypothetical protein
VNAGSSRRGRGVGFVAAALAAGGIASTAIGAVTPPTGDTTAIGFFRDKANAYTDLAGAKIIETGYFFVRKGEGTSVDYWWGRRPPAGYVPATATILVRLTDGKIAAYLAELRAPKIRVRVLMSGGTVYFSTAGCWEKSQPTASPLGTGDNYVFNYGGAHFLPLSKSGATTAVTFTYDWAPSARATETSTFRTNSSLAFTVTIMVAGAQSLSIHKSVTPLSKAPALPVPLPPLRPVPKPLCTTEG